MFSKALGENLQEESLSPGYFFYGEETYLADLFVRELQALLIPPDARDFRLDLFYLDETGWAEILDAARTMPFLFSPWRIIVVRVPEQKPDSEKKRREGGEARLRRGGKAPQGLFRRPAFPDRDGRHPAREDQEGQRPGPLLLLAPGRRREGAKPLRSDRSGTGWSRKRARSGKALTQDAARRLLEIVGNDLRRLDNEIEKLAVFVDERKIIDAADVDQATAWVRDFDSYELDNALEKADLRECLIVLDNLFKAGEKPEQILSRLVGFFRNILVARTQLREKGRDRKAIFKRSSRRFRRPTGTLYQEKFAEFFSLVDGLRESDLARLLEALENVDVRIKSTDAEAQDCSSLSLRILPAQKKGGDYFAGLGAILATWRLSLDL